jgi:hypothetical protein
MNKLLNKRITIICLTLITIVELIITGHMGNSGFLWVAYGIYKILID